MKKIGMVSLLGVMTIVSQGVVADPSMIEISLLCPTITGPRMNVLTNFGNRITGYGSETVAGNPSINKPFFSGFVRRGANIPAKLKEGAYSSDATDFDSTTGIVTCHYASSNGHEAFGLDYYLTNALGGVIWVQKPESITIHTLVGLNND